jgi:hypothetical protein
MNHISLLSHITTVAAFFLAQTATAADTLSFSIGDTEIASILPAGYCLPDSSAKAAAQLTAAADNENVTHATIIKCAAPGQAQGMDDYMILKTPAQVLLPKVTQNELFAELEKVFGTQEFKKETSSEAMQQTVSGNFERVLGTPIQMDGTLHPAGKDDACLYLAGVVGFDAKGVTPYKRGVAVCITTVRNKILSVNAYVPGDNAQAVAVAMQNAYKFAILLKSENP